MNNMGSINYAKEKHMESPYQRYKHLGKLMIKCVATSYYNYPFDLEDSSENERIYTYSYKIPMILGTVGAPINAVITICLELPYFTVDGSLLEAAFNKKYQEGIEEYKKRKSDCGEIAFIQER